MLTADLKICRRTLLTSQVVVGVIQPVLADWAEDVELERVFERFGLMWNARGNVQDFSLAERDLLTADEKFQLIFCQFTASAFFPYEFCRIQFNFRLHIAPV